MGRAGQGDAEMRKVIVSTVVCYDTEGNMAPLSFEWEDGTVYEIDRILDKCRVASQVGGIGLRYTVRVLGRQRYLYYDELDKVWFVETR